MILEEFIEKVRNELWSNFRWGIEKNVITNEEYLSLQFKNDEDFFNISFQMPIDLNSYDKILERVAMLLLREFGEIKSITKDAAQQIADDIDSEVGKDIILDSFTKDVKKIWTNFEVQQVEALYILDHHVRFKFISNANYDNNFYITFMLSNLEDEGNYQHYLKLIRDGIEKTFLKEYIEDDFQLLTKELWEQKLNVVLDSKRQLFERLRALDSKTEPDREKKDKVVVHDLIKTGSWVEPTTKYELEIDFDFDFTNKKKEKEQKKCVVCSRPAEEICYKEQWCDQPLCGEFYCFANHKCRSKY